MRLKGSCCENGKRMTSLTMIAEQYPGLLTRPDEDKLQLAGELLADVMGDPAEADPTLVALMESRLAEYQARPDNVSPWSDVKDRLVNGRNDFGH